MPGKYLSHALQSPSYASIFVLSVLLDMQVLLYLASRSCFICQELVLVCHVGVSGGKFSLPKIQCSHLSSTFRSTALAYHVFLGEVIPPFSKSFLKETNLQFRSLQTALSLGFSRFVKSILLDDLLGSRFSNQISSALRMITS